MPQFRLYVFGLPRLTIGSERITLTPQQMNLCAYLILHREAGTTREQLQSVFWPNTTPLRAQERLRRTLYTLRQALGPYRSLLITERTLLSIAPEASLWVDYEEFNAAWDVAYRAFTPDRVALQTAVELYRGDLLTSVYADWCWLERENAHQRFLTALSDLVVACQHEGLWRELKQYAHLLVKHDPFDEIGHRALMSACWAKGDRSAALRQYQYCAHVLREGLGVEPLAETTCLYETIRRGDVFTHPVLALSQVS